MYPRLVLNDTRRRIVGLIFAFFSGEEADDADLCSFCSCGRSNSYFMLSLLLLYLCFYLP